MAKVKAEKITNQQTLSKKPKGLFKFNFADCSGVTKSRITADTDKTTIESIKTGNKNFKPRKSILKIEKSSRPKIKAINLCIKIIP